MSFQIEIIEGHDPSSYFWIFPVILHKECDIILGDVEGLADEISIEEGYVDCFLAHFFLKYFDDDLAINQERIMCFDEDEVDGHHHLPGFGWNLEYNFYTYDTIKLMLHDIIKTAELLEVDYDNESLGPVKERFSIYYMSEYGSDDYKTEKEKQQQAIKKNIHVVIDFYRCFVKRMRKTLENNHKTEVICIEGP